MEDTWEFDGEEGVKVPTDVTKVVVKDGVKKIPDRAFEHRKEMISVHIPDSVEYIGTAAFGGCTSLRSVRLSSKIDKIEPLTFTDCTSLISLDLIYLPLTRIYWGAFRDCTSLKTIHLPSTLTEIDEEAFQGCKSLTSVKLPPNIDTIHDGTFSNCTSLISVDLLHSKISKIGSFAFFDCTSLKSLEFPSTLDTISGYAFNRCLSLSTLKIPYLKEGIGNAAFNDCLSLTSIHLPPSIVFDGLAFEDCTSIKSIQFYSDDKNPCEYGCAEILVNIIQKHPDVALKSCTDDYVLPLHFALMHYQKHKVEDISTILKAAPTALSVRDPRYHMYPFLLAACTPAVDTSSSKRRITHEDDSDLDSLECVYMLLREAPWVMGFLLKID